MLWLLHLTKHSPDKARFHQAYSAFIIQLRMLWLLHLTKHSPDKARFHQAYSAFITRLEMLWLLHLTKHSPDKAIFHQAYSAFITRLGMLLLLHLTEHSPDKSKISSGLLCLFNTHPESHDTYYWQFTGEKSVLVKGAVTAMADKVFIRQNPRKHSSAVL